MEALRELGGKRGRGLWRFDFDNSSSEKVMESEVGALKTLLAVSRGFDQKF